MAADTAAVETEGRVVADAAAVETVEGMAADVAGVENEGGAESASGRVSSIRGRGKDSE